MRRSPEEIIEEHRAAGRLFSAGGTRSFVRERGDGEAVVLLHGVPASCFLYRKMLAPLARAGFRAVAFDFPGLGLADRPRAFDYSWGGLAGWLGPALDALEIDSCHLVVHDIGGPVGCEWAVRSPDRLRSLTVLNAPLSPATFKPPWTMRPFHTRLGAPYLATMRRRTFAQLFYMQGVANRWSVPREEVWAYYDLLKRGDGGRAFLRIMRGFELTQAKQDLIWSGLRKRSYPAQIVWGERDPALGMDKLEIAQQVLGIEDPTLLPAKHFLQEDQALPLASKIADLARAA
ncbi:MAG: alpha/beta fold hydrolase [Solirubrobacterales bacterium]